MIKKPSTKELLSASLHELLQEIPFSKITIKKITDNCGLTPVVNRLAVYIVRKISSGELFLVRYSAIKGLCLIPKSRN